MINIKELSIGNYVLHLGAASVVGMFFKRDWEEVKGGSK